MGELRYPRHERFVREYIKCGGNGAEAYRRMNAAIPYLPMKNFNCARVTACNLLKRPEIRERLKELQQQVAKRADITVDKILADYQLALNLAKDQARPADIINAATAQAKLVGLLRDRVEHGNAGEFDGLPNNSDIVERVAAEDPEGAKLLMKALGLMDKSINEQTNAEPLENETGRLDEIKPASDAVN